MITIAWQTGDDKIDRLLSAVPGMLSGSVQDTLNLRQIVLLRGAVALMSKVQQAFIVKSRGGVGEDGIRWKPLKRETIAQRRTTVKERRAAGVGGKRYRGLLTAAQNRRWARIFATRVAWLRAKGLSEADAKARAAQIAWATLKNEGAQTKLGLFGGRTVDTLRDTGELLRSLTPGTGNRPSGSPGQICTAVPGRIVIGTNKKPWHHAGVPGKLPARPLWPDKIPDPWWDAVHDAIRAGLIEIFRAVGAGSVRVI